MSGELPGGGKPWFVRRKSGLGYSINPSSREGWLVTLAYVVVILAITPLLFLKPPLTGTIAYLTIFTIATVLLLVLTFRMSAPEWRED